MTDSPTAAWHLLIKGRSLFKGLGFLGTVPGKGRIICIFATVMNWIILIIAGLCETGFAFCLGKTKLAVGTEFWLWMSGFGLLYVLSAVLLAKATQTIPIGVAYPVWTGIGAVGAVLLGIFVFHEPATFWRVFFLSTLILSIVGLKIVG